MLKGEIVTEVKVYFQNLENSNGIPRFAVVKGNGFCSGLTGEHGLLTAIIHRAILDLQSPHILERKDAECFIKSNNNLPFSFTWICDHLLICFNTLRKKIFALKLDHKEKRRLITCRGTNQVNIKKKRIIP